jgi:hypothetical protein
MKVRSSPLRTVFTPRNILVLIFRGWVDSRVWCPGKIPQCPGIEPGTLRLVAKFLNHYATPCPMKEVTAEYLYTNPKLCRSQWLRGLRRRSAAARLLRKWVQIPPGAWMFVCCECCVLSVRGLCDELITRPEESYRLWCVIVCDLEKTLRMRRPWIALGRSATKKPLLYREIHSNAQTESISLSVTYPFVCFKFAHYLHIGE